MVPKLRRKDEAKCEVVLVGIKKKCCSGENERKISRNSVREGKKLFVGERHSATVIFQVN